MPELPEIETIKGVIEPQVKGLTIGSITVNRPEIISRPTAMNFVKPLRDKRYLLWNAEESF